MKVPRILFFSLIILASASLLINVIFVYENYKGNTVVSVPDGDSIQLADGRRVRLLGIDAPEKGRCLADEAKEKLGSIARGKHVRLKDTVTDGYGRVLASVIIEDFPIWMSYLRSRALGLPLDPDPFVNRAMLASGLAKNTFSSTRESAPTLKIAGDAAKSQKLGVYSDRCRSTPVGECVIKGNLRDGKKTYHLTSCDNYAQTVIDEAFGDQWFCTEEEALGAGFRKASGCRDLQGELQPQ